MDQWPTASRRWIWPVDISRHGVFRTVLSLRQTTPATLQMVDRLRLSGSRTETGCNNGRWQKGWGLIFLQTTLLKNCRRYRIPNHFQIKLFAQCGCPKSTNYICFALSWSFTTQKWSWTDWPSNNFHACHHGSRKCFWASFQVWTGLQAFQVWLQPHFYCFYIYGLPCWCAVCWHLTGICPGETLKKRRLMMFDDV